MLQEVPLDSPILVYCNGEDCEDSRFLAQSLREIGYRKLYVYQGGYHQWLQKGLPVSMDIDSSRKTPESFSVYKALDFSRYVPGWVWFTGDFFLLGCGLLILYLLLRNKLNPRISTSALRIVGFLFMLASLHKIAAPAQFARIIENYQLLPLVLVNPLAVVLPWLELFCGFFLLSGRLEAPSAAILISLLGIFVLVVGFNLVRGLDFDCGCFGSAHTPLWRVLLRDLGLLFCCIPALMQRG